MMSMASGTRNLREEGLRPLPDSQTTQNTLKARRDSNLGRAGATSPDAFPVTVAAWQKNSRETIQVRLDSFKDRTVLDVRTWYTDKGGELKPGRAGLTTSVRHLPQLAAALADALEFATERGLINGEGTR